MLMETEKERRKKTSEGRNTTDDDFEKKNVVKRKKSEKEELTPEVSLSLFLVLSFIYHRVFIYKHVCVSHRS